MYIDLQWSTKTGHEIIPQSSAEINSCFRYCNSRLVLENSGQTTSLKATSPQADIPQCSWILLELKFWPWHCSQHHNPDNCRRTAACGILFLVFVWEAVRGVKLYDEPTAEEKQMTLAASQTLWYTSWSPHGFQCSIDSKLFITVSLKHQCPVFYQRQNKASLGIIPNLHSNVSYIILTALRMSYISEKIYLCRKTGSCSKSCKYLVFFHSPPHSHKSRASLKPPIYFSLF